MAFAFVSARGTQIVGATGAVVSTGATGAGNPLVLAVAWNPNTRSLTGGTDTKGNVWQLGLNKQSPNRSCGFIFCNPTTPLALADVVTPTFGGAITSAVGILAEFSGGSVQRDATGNNSGAAGNATTVITPTNAANFGILSVGTASAAGGDYAPDAGWTAIASVTHSVVNLSLDMHYKVNMAAALTTITNIPTVGSNWATAAADFIAALSVMGIGELLPMTGAQ